MFWAEGLRELSVPPSQTAINMLQGVQPQLLLVNELVTGH